MKKKPFYPYLLAAVIILVFELLIGNFSSLASLNYEKTDLTEQMQDSGNLAWNENGLTAPEGTFSLSVSGLDIDVKNLHLDFDLPADTVAYYTVILTDGGNFYPYSFPKQALIEAVPSTSYVAMHPYGNVTSLTIEFNIPADKTFTINEISVNAPRPLMIHWMRMIILYVLFVFFYALRPTGKTVHIPFDVNNRAQNSITLVLVVLLLISGFCLSQSNKLFDEASKPHHQQYKELAVAISEHHTYVVDHAAEELINAPNPYDTIYLQANGIQYQADYAYFNGKYYVYFGLIPEVLLYLPYYLLTGNHLSNQMASFFFYSIFVVAVFGLFRQILKRYFKELPYFAYLIISSMVVTCGTYSYLIERADLYNVPIIAGTALTALGLFFWITGLNAEKYQGIYFLFGSFSMAMVVGCRPQMFLFSFLAFPLFWQYVIKERKLFSKTSVLHSVAITVPYFLVAGVLMYYNYERFGSPFDFGATYSLTNNDMNLRGISIERMLHGCLSFLFLPINMDGVFPFINSMEVESSYMGRLVTEFFYGGIISCHVLTWILFAGGFFKKELKEKHLTVFSLLALSASVIIGMLDANQAGVLQRYSADMAWGIFFISAIFLFILTEKLFRTEHYRFGIYFLTIGFMLQLAYAFMIVFAPIGGIYIAKYNPELFYRAASLFHF